MDFEMIMSNLMEFGDNLRFVYRETALGASWKIFSPATEYWVIFKIKAFS